MSAGLEPIRYVVEFPDGTVASRTSRSRQYSHAIQAWHVSTEKWDLLQWCETWDASSRAAARLQSKYVLGRVWTRITVVRVRAQS